MLYYIKFCCCAVIPLYCILCFVYYESCVSIANTLLYVTCRIAGDFLNNEAHGYGKYTYSDGSTFTGHWSNGVKSGQGVVVYSHGTTIEAEWIDDKICGRGKDIHYMLVYDSMCVMSCVNKYQCYQCNSFMVVYIWLAFCL